MPTGSRQRGFPVEWDHPRGRRGRKGGNIMEEAVVLMAKAPVAGRVKTRLCPPLDRRESARLYACMLGDTAAEMSALTGVRRYLFLDPPESVDCLRGLPFSAFERFPQ